jgi:hypothetical protein
VGRGRGSLRRRLSDAFFRASVREVAVTTLMSPLPKVTIRNGRSSLALRLMILTFARTTELRAARWSEFENLDGNEPLWRVPAERMKMKR